MLGDIFIQTGVNNGAAEQEATGAGGEHPVKADVTTVRLTFQGVVFAANKKSDYVLWPLMCKAIGSICAYPVKSKASYLQVG